MSTSTIRTSRSVKLVAATALLPVLALTLGACGSDNPTEPGAGPGDPSATSADPSAPSTTAPSPTPTPETTPSESPTPAPKKARLIGYAGGESPGVEIDNRADVKNLRGAPEDFKKFIGDVVKRVKAKSTCNDPGAAVGVTVETLRTDGYAVGGVNDCGGYAALWAKVDGRWKQVEGTQDSWDCAVLKKFRVPSDVVGKKCFAYHGENKEHAYQQA